MKAIRWTPEQLQAHEKRLNRFGEPTKPSGRPKGSGNRPKYGNMPVGQYPSKREAARAAALRLLAAAGAITDLKEQVRYELIPAQYVDGKCVERAVTYTADFTFVERGKLIVEDVKSPATKTQQYVLRRKLMLWVYHIHIREVE